MSFLGSFRPPWGLMTQLIATVMVISEIIPKITDNTQNVFSFPLIFQRTSPVDKTHALFFPAEKSPAVLPLLFFLSLIFPRTARCPPSYFSPAIIRLKPRKDPSPAIVVAAAAGTTCTAATESMAAKWAQKTVVIPPQRRGCHLSTLKILREIEQDLSGFKCDLAHLFLQHTIASLTINENYDLDVQDDTETFVNRIVPERLPFTSVFIGSMVGTIYVSMVLHNYILSVIFSMIQRLYPERCNSFARKIVQSVLQLLNENGSDVVLEGVLKFVIRHSIILSFFSTSTL
ncbi:hypothetical protein Cni_G06829 [Canna indica]|uniref:Uncharacterized protein n=1 Tax=Canna indica TaxID=4628 RepID=A0AAQ3JXE9_9LILI|nr:hypothetical protein Cni_G06829 [Canna indica]